MSDAPAPAPSLSGRHFVVTGANAGVGLATVRVLAARGARVTLACRSREKAEAVIDATRAQTGNDELGFVELDLGSFASVRACADILLADDRPIHVLINNAGLGGGHGRSKDGFEIHFGVNHLGHFLLTTLLLDRLKASAPARVVNVSSRGHYRVRGINFERVTERTRTRTGVPEYCVSKLANVLFTKELGRRLEGTGVTTYAAHPGLIASEIWRRVPWPLHPLIMIFMDSIEEGAQTQLYCATSAAAATETGSYYQKCRPRKPSPAAADRGLAATLWQKSEAWVALERPRE